MNPAAVPLILPNGLRVNILHDPQASRAAALIHLNAGSHHEPARFPGLAHLFEHVVFAGSQQFQGDDRLMMWAQAEGAKLNATTHATSTAWFFDMTPAKFAAGLARMTDMLARPLLTCEAVQQEVAVIDAEYAMLSGHADALCNAALSLAYAAPAQLQGFHVGNRRSFGDDIPLLQQALLDYHQRFFAAENLTLWLQGPQPAEELAALAKQYGKVFAAGKSEPPAASATLMMHPDRPVQLRLAGSTRLRFSFTVTRAPALALLRQLLTDEAPGSLLDVLRSRDIADEVHISLPYTGSNDAILSIEFLLCDARERLRAAAETLFCHWLQQLPALTDGHLNHYSHLAQQMFGRLTPLDQLRAQVLDFLPAAAQGWQRLLRELQPENMTRLCTTAEKSEENASAQGFTLPVSFTPWPTVSDNVTLLPFRFHAEQAKTPTLHEAIQTLGAPMSLRQASLARASLRALSSEIAHEGGSLTFSHVQGNGLLQFSGPHDMAVRTLNDALHRLRTPCETAVIQGERLFDQEQRRLESDIAIRALLAKLPDVMNGSDGPQTVEFPASGEDSAILMFCPLAETTAGCLAATHILASLIEPKFFQQLRVEKNVGYVVSCRFHQAARRDGILFALQSPAYGAQTLLGYIDAFIAEIPAMLAGVSAQVLEEKRGALRESLNTLQADKQDNARQKWLREFSFAPQFDEAAIAGVTPQRLMICAQSLGGSRKWRLKLAGRKQIP